MRWATIRWKPSATAQDRIDCMAFIQGQAEPAMPSEYFINDVWRDDREFDRITDDLAQKLASIPLDGTGWHFKIGAREGGASWQGNINRGTAMRVLKAIGDGL